MNNEIIILNNWEKAKHAIAECKSIDEVKDIRDKAEALRAYAQQARETLEIQNNIVDIKVRAERKMGEFSKELPKIQGSRTDITSSHSGNKLSILKDAGIKHYERYEAMANLPEEVFNKYIEETKKNNERLATGGIVKFARELEKRTDIERQKEDIRTGKIILPDGKFEVIMMDVPWPYGTQYSSDGRRVANPYPEMSIDSIKSLDIPSSDDCILFFWTTHKFLRDSFDIIESYGFEHKGLIVWDKEKMGMGDWLRMQCEFCLVCIKGKPIWDTHDIRDIIREPRREHSRKPEAIYRLIEKNFVGRKLDYFSREIREGWEQIGNDTKRLGK